MYFRLSVMLQKKKDPVASFQEDWLTKEEFKSWLRKVFFLTVIHFIQG